MFNKSLAKLLLSSAILMVASCKGIEDPPRWDLCQTKDDISAQPIPSTDDLVVYLDTSASMAGYISPNGKTLFSASPDGNTVFSKALLEIRDVVTMLSPEPNVAVRRVDTIVSRPTFNNLDLAIASRDRGYFKGKETNLAGAIRSFSEPLDPESESQAPPKFHILVTDGVQSTAKDNPSDTCVKGSDARCVKKGLRDLINKGWGGVVLGLRSEFNGILYSEIAPISMQVSTGKDPKNYRPFYLYIFSADRVALDNLVQALRRRLSPLAGDANYREYQLSASYSAGPASIETYTDKGSEGILSITQEKVKDGEIPRLTVRSKLSAVKSGLQSFSVIVMPNWSDSALAGGSPDELASALKWELKQVFPIEEIKGNRYPDIQLNSTNVSEGKVSLSFKAGWENSPGNPSWRMFRLLGTIDTNDRVPAWVSNWSTQLDTTPDTVNRTLNLESSLANLWNNPFITERPVAEVWVRIGGF